MENLQIKYKEVKMSESLYSVSKSTKTTQIDHIWMFAIVSGASFTALVPEKFLLTIYGTWSLIVILVV